MEKKTYIGVDLGGTKLLVGEMDREGNILRTKRYPSGRLTKPEAMALIQKALDEFLAEKTPGCEPCAIGIGMVGRIDNRTGTWYEISPDRKDTVEVGSILSARYGIT